VARRPKISEVVGAALICSLLLAACGGGKQLAAGAACRTIAGTSRRAVPFPGSWPDPNADLANTRVAPGSSISSASVSELEPAWSFKITGVAAAGVGASGSLAANPIVQGGVVYVQDLDANVYALSLASGQLVWEYECNAPEKTGPGPNGVAVVGGRVYGATNTAVFALDAATGRPEWVNSRVLAKGQGTFGIQPQVADGRVYLASQYAIGPGGGVLVALNAATGAVLWKFNTVTGPDPGVESLGLGSGGAWETPLVGSDGSVTYGIGNPYQSMESAIAHPAAQLYTDSDVNLDSATGKLRWYYQGVPNDFKDYDMQASPISAVAGRVPVVIGSGKMGYVYEMNARTGRLIWRTPVGEQNGSEGDSLKLLERRITLKVPYTIAPGSLGGVLTNLALAHGTVYAATLNVPLAYTSLSQPTAVKPVARDEYSGEVEALSAATGRVVWATKLRSVPLGAVTVSNDLVLTTTYDTLVALNRRTGAIVYERKLPTTTNAPIAIAGRTIIVPAGGITGKRLGASFNPQVVAYRVPGG
jgi:alcohol dehydrogenase (cytochrome c)